MATELKQAIHETLSEEQTTLFLDLLEKKDSEFLEILSDYFKANETRVIRGKFARYETDGVILVWYLAIHNRIDDICTLFRCGMNNGIVNRRLYGIAFERDNIELYNLMKDKIYIKHITLDNPLLMAIKRGKIKLVKYFLNEGYHNRYVKFHHIKYAAIGKNELIFYIVYQYINPDKRKKYCKRLREKGYYDSPKRIERGMCNLTLHQQCILNVQRNRTEVPEWFPSVLLEFSMH